VLLQLTVENHLSFREPVTLSMLAPEGASGPTVREGARRTLTTAAIYGANASGKSNVVKALRFLIELVTNGVAAGQKLGTNPFRLSGESMAKPTRFQIDVQLAEGYFAYGFAVTKEAIVEEWLMLDDATVFERTVDAGITLGDAVPASDRELWTFVAKTTRAEQPFLHEAEDKNLALVAPLGRWLRESVRFVKPDEPANDRLVAALHDDRPLLAYTADLLKRFGTGVEQMTPVELPLPAHLTPAALAENAVAIDIRGVDIDFARGTIRSLGFVHEGAEGPPYIALVPKDESDGTLRLIDLAPVSYAARTAPGSPLFVIDELDRSLHPLLSRALLREFIDAAKGRPSGPQLLFTTHDTSLLSKDLLDPASVWFTEKDRTGASSLYSLSEFDPEQLAKLMADLEQGYLNGRFGAIPFVADDKRLGWKP
jgi:hypothetical protein